MFLVPLKMKNINKFVFFLFFSLIIGFLKKLIKADKFIYYIYHIYHCFLSLIDQFRIKGIIANNLEENVVKLIFYFLMYSYKEDLAGVG